METFDLRFPQRSRQSAVMLVVVLTLVNSAVAVEPAPETYVADWSAVIDAHTEYRLIGLLQEIEQKTLCRMIVLTVDSTGEQDIEEYALERGNEWAFGANHKSASVLLVVAVKDRQWRIEVGRAHENVLPNAFVAKVGRRYMVPAFKKGCFGRGIWQAVTAIGRRVAEAKDVKLTTIPSKEEKPVEGTTEQHAEVFPPVKGRIAPVSPVKPIPTKVWKLFEEFHGEAVREALSTDSPADDATLATELFEAARRHSSHQEFSALLLDAVVYLGSASEIKMQMVYAALKTQLEADARSERKCLEKMKEVAEIVAGGERKTAGKSKWLFYKWTEDAKRLTALQMSDKDYAAARATLTTLQEHYRKLDAEFPEELSKAIEFLEFAKGFEEAHAQCLSEINTRAERPQTRLFLALYALTSEGDLEDALAHLRKSNLPEAEEAAQKIEAYINARNSEQHAVGLAESLEALAAETDGTFLKALWWQESAAILTKAVATGRMGKEDQLHAQLLKERLDEKLTPVLDKLPGFVRTAFEVKEQRSISATVSAGAEFFGLGANADKIVYVVDRSGSMTDSIMYVKYELKRSIRMLKPNQQFYVVFYSSGPPVEMPSGCLVPATERNKLGVCEFIDSIVPVGQTDPSKALEQAFRTGPEVIYLLTDGEFDKKVLHLINRLNRGDKVAVHTLCFVYTGGEALLRKIAQANGGTYKYIGENELAELGR